MSFHLLGLDDKNWRALMLTRWVSLFRCSLSLLCVKWQQFLWWMYQNDWKTTECYVSAQVFSWGEGKLKLFRIRHHSQLSTAAQLDTRYSSRLLQSSVLRLVTSWHFKFSHAGIWCWDSRYLFVKPQIKMNTQMIHLDFVLPLYIM